MDTLQSLFPDVDVLLRVAPEDLALVLLRLARQFRQDNGLFWPDGVAGFGLPGAIAVQNNPYPFNRRKEIEAHVNEAWNYLRGERLIIPAPGINGSNGYMVLSKAGETACSAQGFEHVRAARDFPKKLLHPSIADKVWAAMMRGDFDQAVFIAFRTVEEEVRSVGGYTANDIGVALMRKAFDVKKGNLTDLNRPEAEREALAHLFAGAIGSYKNPHSHRTVNLTDVREAQEQVMLATHLLRIVDARR